MTRSIRFTAALGALGLMYGTAVGLEPERRCEIQKLQAAGTYGHCLLHAEARAAKLGGGPHVVPCDRALVRQWTRAESKFGPACPTTNDLPAVQRFVTDYTAAVLDGLRGLGLAPLCPVLPATGQTVVTVPGDDGDIQAGAPLRFRDNHDGTISDLNTKLTWEKKVGGQGVSAPDGQNLHNANNNYPWAGTCSGALTAAVACFSAADCPRGEACLVDDSQGTGMTIWDFVDALNAQRFAGHGDWRVPNAKEFTTLQYTPDDVDPAFDGAGCDGACLDLADPNCSCNPIHRPSWTSTTYAPDPARAWSFDNQYGSLDPQYGKTFKLTVRAVRGGN